MRRSRFPWTAIWAAVLAAMPASAQAGPVSSFDFSATVESLAEAAQSGSGLPVGRYVVLTGTLRASAADEGEPFTGRLELAAGQWIGTSRIVLRTVTVEVAGDAFRDLFLRDSPNFLSTGSTVLVVARVVGTRDAPEGGRTAVLEGVHLRRLESQ